MPITHAHRQRPGNDPETGGDGWEICADAVSEMETILDGMEEYPDLHEETTALRTQLDRIASACSPKKRGKVNTIPCVEPRNAAKKLIDHIPLHEVFQDQALADVFLSELLLALARESSYKNRRERQKEGIAEAKAQGVRFGAPSHPLPDNFEEVRRAWRGGQFNLSEAAERCGMARTTFFNAARRLEAGDADAAPVGTEDRERRPGRPRVQARTDC